MRCFFRNCHCTSECRAFVKGQAGPRVCYLLDLGWKAAHGAWKVFNGTTTDLNTSKLEEALRSARGIGSTQGRKETYTPDVVAAAAKLDGMRRVKTRCKTCKGEFEMYELGKGTGPGRYKCPSCGNEGEREPVKDEVVDLLKEHLDDNPNGSF